MRKKFCVADNPFELLTMFEQKHDYFQRLERSREYGYENFKKTYERIENEVKKESDDGSNKIVVLELYLSSILVYYRMNYIKNCTKKYVNQEFSWICYDIHENIKELGKMLTNFKDGDDPIEYYKFMGYLYRIYAFLDVDPFEVGLSI